MKVTGVILDISSIQNYVFQSNRLQANAGASFIVQNAFSGIPEILADLGISHPEDWNYWKNTPGKFYLAHEKYASDIAYQGGGNCLLLFKKHADAVSFAKKWTTELLVKYPGLSTNIGIDELELESTGDLKGNFTPLYHMLRHNKNRYTPATSLPKFGMNEDCSQTGLSAETRTSFKGKNEKVSAEFLSKVHHFDAAEKDLRVRFLNNGYAFPKNFDDLGNTEGKENTIAVVHIDGNSMGIRFQNAQSLKELRALSHSVEKITQNAMRKLVDWMSSQYDTLKENLHLKRDYLPIRPIIVGGDDVTYVSHGLVAIDSAERFIRYLEEEVASDGESITACAGVSITKPKFPFHRSYQIAEELCNEAKKRARSTKKPTSWLDYHIGYVGHYGNIQQIRKEQFSGENGYLLTRPFEVSDKLKSIRSIALLKDSMKQFVAEDNYWPRSKRVELQEQLMQNIQTMKLYLMDREKRNQRLPKKGILKNYSDSGWKKNKNNRWYTPYYEILELMEIYPEWLIDIKEQS